MEENIQESQPFSVVADFDGDIGSLFNTRVPKTLPVLPLRNMCVFPGVVAPVMVTRESTRLLVAEAEKRGSLVVVVSQKDPEDDQPCRSGLYDIGVLAKVVRRIALPTGVASVILQTFGRVMLGSFTKTSPYIRCRIEGLTEVLPDEGDKEFEVLVDACRDMTIRFLQMGEGRGEEAAFAVRNIKHPVFLLSFIATNMPFPIDEKVGLLTEKDVKRRGFSLLTVLNRECQYASLKQNIQKQTQEDLDKQQKEYFLQQQMKNIKSQLGEEGDESQVVSKLRERAASLTMPDKVREAFDKELEKLGHIHTASAEYATQLDYLQTLCDLPWGNVTVDRQDFRKAKGILEKQHYGLERVKERILEQIAIAQYRADVRMPILCLYGPPGVGKTSLGRSVAEALGRRYARISLGGVHDEAEIRGHRRTYIGSMPGQIIKALKKTGTDNPVFVLDEIDKVQGNNISGDPQSALLEVLDPEQNNAFHDNYIDVDYDLSRVFFICTANTLSGVPRPLLDRMELIEVEGYSLEEKREIANRHLIPAIEEELLSAVRGKVHLTPAALDCVIEKYTRESGVRMLQKQLKTLYRKVAVDQAEKGRAVFDNVRLRPADVQRMLGKPLYRPEQLGAAKGQCGVATGLAWTAVGGEILFVETSTSRSKTPKLTLTGNLGDVMKESAMLALEYVKSHADRLGIDPRLFEQYSLHVHVPEGATPKDGPSAGITLATSIASALTRRVVRHALAMTGEITLRGKVLPVGGIKEKVLAAIRSGVKDIVVSEENRRDVDEIGAKYLSGVKFHYVGRVEEVLKYALLDERDGKPLVVEEETADDNK